MSPFRVAVDYGTSSTVAFLRWPDGRVRPLLFDDSPLLPSAVYLEPDGRLLTGRDAVRSARFDPARFEANPKRRIDDRDVLLGGQIVPVEELVAATLRRVWEEATRIAGERPGGVTLTYPAAWGEMRRRVLARAVDLAGLPPGELVAEPVAAATYFATVLGHAVPPGAAVVVYDLGAGTFDVSVLRREPAGFNTLASDGLVDVGGLDLDALLVEHLRRTRAPHHEGAWRRLDAPGDADAQRAFRELWDGAREAKEALSRRASVPVPVPGIAEPQHVTREELEAAARQVLAQTVSVTVATMRTAGPVAGLFLVGGSTRVPLVASMLHRATGIAPTVIEQPELVVAEGALHASAAGPPAAPSALEAVPVASRLEAPPAPGAEAAVAPVAADVAAEEPPRRSGRHAVLAAAGCTLLVLVLLLAVRLWPEGRHNEARGTPAASGSTAPSPTAGPSASAAVVPPSVAVQVSSGGKTTSARPAGSATTTRPAGPVTVTATLVKTKLTFNGPCPPPQYGPIQLLVDFTVSGPTQIDYYWKSDPAWDPDFSPLTMTVSKAGTTRANGGFYGGWSHTPGSTVSHWVQLVVTKPVAYTSEQVTWSATCTTVTEP